jgi:uncharacterized protein (DUF3084 family)
MKITEENKENLTAIEKIANAVMWWIGSIPSLIVHTVLFICAFLLPILNLVELNKMLLVLTTILSLEAIYLAIFIQMSVNKSGAHIEDLREDIEDIQEDLEEISEDIDEISEDIDEIQEDIEEINEDDEEDNNERAKNTILKNNVATNKSEIRFLKKQLIEMQSKLENLGKP